MLSARFLVACALVLAPVALGCGPGIPALQPSAEASTASSDEEGVVSVRLTPPDGDWVPNEVSVENAKLVSRDGDAPLQLSVQRSKPKQGETTVEGADEPIRITVTYISKKTKEKGQLVFLVAAPPDPKPGAVPVTVGK